jgi:hypothetical protein
LQDQLMPVGSDGRLGTPRVISTDYYGFTWDRTGRYFYGLDGVAIGQFVFDPAAGSMKPNDPPEAEGSTGHQFLALKGHPNGKWVYSVEEGAIGLFALDAASGALRSQQYLGSPVPGATTSWTSLVVHPQGRFLYCLGYVRDSQLGFVDLFSIDPTSGGLTFVARQSGGEVGQIQLDSLQAPVLLGDLLLVGGRSTAAGLEGKPVLSVYRIDRVDGRLRAIGAPALLQPAATTSVNFIAAAAGNG